MTVADLTMAELMSVRPAAVPVLMRRGLACPGCAMAPFMTVREAAEHVGCATTDVYAAVKRWGLVFRHVPRSRAALREVVIAGYAAGLTPTQIANQHGFKRTDVAVMAWELGGAATLRGGTALRPHHRYGPPVPPELMEDYRLLTKKGGYRARQAKIVLGLIKEDTSD